MSQSVGDTTRKRTRTDSAFFSAISSAHDSAQSLLRICANEIEKLLKKDIVSNFGRCAFLRNIDQPCIELILSSCDAKQLQEIERIHEVRKIMPCKICISFFSYCAGKIGGWNEIKY
jgi:hypothetical protein